MRHLLSSDRVFLLSVLILSGCSSDGDSTDVADWRDANSWNDGALDQPVTGTGATLGAGAASATSGGAFSTGGSPASGSTNSAGALPSTGGINSTGGLPSSGGASTGGDTSSTGGAPAGCSDPEWSREQAWTDYAIGQRYQHGGIVYECQVPSFCYIIPSDPVASHYGWTELEVCGDSGGTGGSMSSGGEGSGGSETGGTGGTGASTGASTGGTGGAGEACTVPEWDAQKPHYEYEWGERNQRYGTVYECHNVSHCFRDPGDASVSSAGWTPVGDCADLGTGGSTGGTGGSTGGTGGSTGGTGGSTGGTGGDMSTGGTGGSTGGTGGDMSTGGTGGSTGGTGGDMSTGGTGGSTGGTGGDMSTGGTGGSTGSECDGIVDLLSEAEFNALFPSRDSAYTYQGMLDAAEGTGQLPGYPLFAREGTCDQRKRELAAFLANVARETGALIYIEEIIKTHSYCDTRQVSCPAGTKSYYGRGPIQITWNYNYASASQDLFGDSRLLTNPGLVASSPDVAWATAFWFWMTGGAGGGTSPHDVIASGGGFGSTIQIINGAAECPRIYPSPPFASEAVSERVCYYEKYTQAFGVTTGGGDLACGTTVDRAAYCGHI